MLSAQTIAAVAAKGRLSSLLTPLAVRCLVARHTDILCSSMHSKGSRYRSSTFSTDSRAYYRGVEGSIEDDEAPVVHFAPQRVRKKVTSASDAISLVRDGDTICVSGFVCQGVPEAVLKALGERYEETGSPHNLTLFFGGGPGDWDDRGLNHLAKTKEGSAPMLKRTIGSHYGQVPKVAELALSEAVEAWTLPLGSISRMIRAQATHSPGHITSVGIGTYVDPDVSGGASNEAALKSTIHKGLVTKLSLDGNENLMYKALPINIAVIRGTTADAQGNITLEEESLLCDQKIIAAAARNSGGIVIAQVKRLAADGSLPSRSVAIPGPLVDCVVVVDEEDHDRYHPMSFEQTHNPFFTGEIRSPRDELSKMPLDERKIIARRAFFGLRPNTVVNLGVGLPEGVAAVAGEEGMIDYVTLTTEPGVFGGQPASGRSFGPAVNASALVEMNQMFDFYDGGGLNTCFLGAAQVGRTGDVNVSRMARNRLTGPGGFIDITQSTKNIWFLTPLTTKGLELSIPGDGTVNVLNEGAVKKFVPEVFEKTFSGDEAVRRGQTVFYVTERAVFRRTAAHDTIELIEIAPGLGLQKDILDQMDFDPVISPHVKIMDPRIFIDDKMKIRSELFGSLEERCTYHEPDHTFFLELFGITIDTEEDIAWIIGGLGEILRPLVDKKGPINMVINYDGCDIRKGLEEKYSEAVAKFEKEYYNSVKRFAGTAFHRAKLGKQLRLNDWDPDALFDQFDVNKNGRISAEELRDGMTTMFGISLSPSHINQFYNNKGAGDETEGEISLDREAFKKALMVLFK